MVIQRHHVRIEGPRQATGSAQFRYSVLERVWRGSRKGGVCLLAFGFDQAGLRLVFEGSATQIDSALLDIASDIRQHDGRVRVRVGEFDQVEQIASAVAWAHRGPVDADPGLPGALASAWSSHRDLLGYRVAPFYDRGRLAGRVKLDDVHAACGGGPPPSCGPKRPAREDLLLLSRVAASVLGREPADPKCFSLFAQLAKARGWATREIAAALLVSTRRVRQLCDVRAGELSLAFTALCCPDSVGRLP